MTTVENRFNNRNKPLRNEFKYDSSMGMTEQRLLMERDKSQIIGMLPASRRQYLGGKPKLKTINDFSEYPSIHFANPNLIFDKIINDAKTLPVNTRLRDAVTLFFNEALLTNLNNIFKNAPAFFVREFIENEINFEFYQQYFYLICLIEYVIKNEEKTELRELESFEDIKKWVSIRRDPSLEVIIVGPKDNSEFNINYREHYNMLISSSNNMSDIMQFSQLTAMQVIGSDVLATLNFMKSYKNVYYKTPDEARKFVISIDSSKDVLVSNESNNNLIFDASYVQLGDTSEGSTTAEYDKIELSDEKQRIESLMNIQKLKDIFNNYSRIRILEMIVANDTYITSLDSFEKIFLVLDGVVCSGRIIYNSVDAGPLMIAGSFIKTNRGYEFKQDTDVLTYKDGRTDIKYFKLFLTTDPSKPSSIVPNEYVLKFTKDKYFQHPVTTGLVQDEGKNTITISKQKMIHEHKLISTLTAAQTDRNTIQPLDIPDRLIWDYNDKSVVKAGLNKMSECVQKLTQNKIVLPIIQQIHNIINTAMDALDDAGALLGFSADIKHIANDKLFPEIIREIHGKFEPTWGNYSLIIDDEVIKSIRTEIKTSDNDSINSSNFRVFFYKSLGQINFTNCNTFAELLQQVKIFTKVYMLLLSMLKFTAHDPVITTKYTNENEKFTIVDGKINGKYFRFDDEGKIIFKNSDGKAFSSPLEEFDCYLTNNNDLCLYNLYNYANTTYTPIENGSFMYSEMLHAIQNLKGFISDGSKTNDTFKFDNNYIIKYIDSNGNETFSGTSSSADIDNKTDMFYEYHDEIIYAAFEDDSWYVEFVLDKYLQINTTLELIGAEIFIPCETPPDFLYFENGTIKYPGESNFNMLSGMMSLNPTTNMYFIYGISNDGILIQGTMNDISITDDGLSGTLNDGSMMKSFQGRLKSFMIQDSIGNTIKRNPDGKISITNTIVTSLDEMIDATIDIPSNKIIYNYDQQSNTLTVEHMKYEGSEENITYESKLHVILGDKSELNTFFMVETNHKSYSALSGNVGDNIILNGKLFKQLVRFSEDINQSKSNLFKAFQINGINIANSYWNKQEFINSLMLSKIYAANKVRLDSQHIFTSSNCKIYTYEHDKLRSLTGTYIVTPDDILLQENNIKVPSALKSIFVCENGILNFTATPEISIVSDDTPRKATVDINDLGGDAKYHIVFLFSNNAITEFNISEYKNKKLIVLGSYKLGIYNQQPTFVDDCEVTFTIIENIVKKISVSRVNYKTTEFLKDNGVVFSRSVHTVKYSNIPGKYISSTNDNSQLFNLSLFLGKKFKYHPIVKFYENSIVAPRYINESGIYLTVVNKFNQNISSKMVNIKGNYTHSKTEQKSVGKKINPNNEYLIESIDNQTIIIGGINKYGTINDLAIDSDLTYLIPTKGKFTVTFEFS